jgi:pyruvate-ferredoxin/flavodoxin oxidoreductase
MKENIKYPGIPVTTNGNQLESAFTETLIADAGIFYPITPSTEQGEYFQAAFARGDLNAFGESLIAIETEGEHAAQGGAIAFSVTGKRVVNFTSGQGIVYGMEQYYHAPGKLSTLVLEVGARALTKHALNVHCGHDDIYSVLDTGWIMFMAKDAQQAADQAIILRKVTELALNPGINIQDGFLTTHLERRFLKPEPGLIREYLGHPADLIDCPTAAQVKLFGAKRRRIPEMIDLKNPVLLGPVQNQEHYMNGVAARRNNFSEPIMPFIEKSYEDFAALTGREYGPISKYNCDNSDTVFVALGSAAENIEAVSDYLKASRNEEVGVIHINVLRPFPEAAVIKAIKGKKNVIILERTDDSLSPDNPLSRDIRSCLDKAVDHFYTNAYAEIETIDPASEKPQVFSGVYGLGSRDFRPEGIIGAYDFCLGKIARKDGKTVKDGARFFFIGIDHDYSVISEETPSCLPEHSIAVRFHSIGGWGMITTGKNLVEIMGELSDYIAVRDNSNDENGNSRVIFQVSANPKYGSEKKGAPTSYFIVAAPEKVRVNCDLHHVNVVLCCDPKAFLHTNPLEGLSEGGAFVWESGDNDSGKVWQRIPKRYRQEIIARKIRIFVLHGFDIARRATDREDLQLRMQGNAFLGALFHVSGILEEHNIPETEFLNIVRKQYEKKFGRFGGAVIESNMKVMKEGFEEILEIFPGDPEETDLSFMTGPVIMPCLAIHHPDKLEKPPLFGQKLFDSEYRSGLGYNQPASTLASVGVVAAGTGARASKFISRRMVPVFNPSNCTQCMECITICPDSALPNTAQEIQIILKAALNNYVSSLKTRNILTERLPEIEGEARKVMLVNTSATETKASFKEIIKKQFVKEGEIFNILPEELKNLLDIIEILPIAYEKTSSIFKGPEKKEPGSGGVFSIFVNDLCKGCGACVEACGSHNALEMVEETEVIHARHLSATNFLNFLPDTPARYLGLFDSEKPEETKAAALRYHLMLQSKYTSFTGGDGACAGCGEKSVLRSIATLTEAFMRPVYALKAKRLSGKAENLIKLGLPAFKVLKDKDKESYEILRKTILHVIMGYGGTNNSDTESRIKNEFTGSDTDIITALAMVLRLDAYNHYDLKTLEETHINGMSVMAMTANTGCNTVFSSTPPNNPHPYPWMNSLFQDGATIGWLLAESFIQNHSRRSVCPERLADYILNDDKPAFSDDDYFKYTHFSDLLMTDQEINELPKIWVVGGDGGMGDIGFQNVSKVIMQNRPNVKMLMLDTQVYSNTGGQNSESSVMTGGFDMNQAGPATEGKLTEMKSVSMSFLNGHGSPFIAQGSIGDSAAFYKNIVDALSYRGTAYIQAYTPCPPEHGIPDHASARQAQLSRDSRVFPQFVNNPELGERFSQTLSIKGNPDPEKDWYLKLIPGTRERFAYTPAHWALTEARFKRHHKKVNQVEGLISLETKLESVTMNDIVYRRFLLKDHPSYIPLDGVYIVSYHEDGTPEYHIISRQLVVFCIERGRPGETCKVWQE